jgi:hypothetical protein
MGVSDRTLTKKCGHCGYPTMKADDELYQAPLVISRRRTMYWHLVDLSAWEAHRWTIGR